MSNDQELIKTLFEKYVKGSASPEEVKQLFSLISDKQYDEEMKKLLLGENAARLYRLKPPVIDRKPAALITDG